MDADSICNHQLSAVSGGRRKKWDFAAANCFPWNLAPKTGSNSSGRGLIPLSSSERRAKPPASLCQRGVCAAVPVLLLAGVHLCTGDVGLPGRGQGLWLLYVGWGGVSPTVTPPHWRLKDLSLIFSEMLFKQCLHSCLHSTENSEI